MADEVRHWVKLIVLVTSRRDTSSGDSRWVPKRTSCSCIHRVQLRSSMNGPCCRCDRSARSLICAPSYWCRLLDATSTDWIQRPAGTQWSSCTSTSTVRQRDVAELGSDRGRCNSAGSAKLRQTQRHQFDIEKAF